MNKQYLYQNTKTGRFVLIELDEPTALDGHEFLGQIDHLLEAVAKSARKEITTPGDPVWNFLDKLKGGVL